MKTITTNACTFQDCYPVHWGYRTASVCLCHQTAQTQDSSHRVHRDPTCGTLHQGAHGDHVGQRDHSIQECEKMVRSPRKPVTEARIRSMRMRVRAPMPIPSKGQNCQDCPHPPQSGSTGWYRRADGRSSDGVRRADGQQVAVRHHYCHYRLLSVMISEGRYRAPALRSTKAASAAGPASCGGRSASGHQ